MAISLIQAFQQTIEPSYVITKNGNMFEITETAKSSTNKLLRIGGCQGYAFSLDKDGRHPWLFINNSPLAGVVSVCDGILILKHDNTNYIIALDLKSNSHSKKAFQQIHSGISLCKWLCGLFKIHNHTYEDAEFIGVICKSRGAVAKKTSSKSLRASLSRDPNYDDIPVITMSNPGTIHISDLLKLLE